jgi:hypothetical protein
MSGAMASELEGEALTNVIIALIAVMSQKGT